ncbi:uncharacterized protein LOC135488981 [Lineus longissimus]|uniref:uncharacterized protein LOC135488981 n=1 Tax=Lineus longissimus TaxID=88925 RepID=UPI00315DE800
MMELGHVNPAFADKDTFDSTEMEEQKSGPARPYAATVNMVNTVQDDDDPASNFSEESFDPISRSALQATRRTHRTQQDLNNLVFREGAALQQNTLALVSLQDRLSHDQLLKSLLFDGERVQNNNRWLYYSCVEFQDDRGTNAILPPMMIGKACLTDQRLLLLSAERAMNASFTKYGDPKTTSGGYDVETLLTDNIHYKPIPLSSFYSIELHIASSSKSGVQIHAKPPLLCFFCSCLGCPKQWISENPNSSNDNRRVLTLGATLPPWGTRSFIRIHLNPSMPLVVARDFVSCLQCYSRNLHYGSCPPGT